MMAPSNLNERRRYVAERLDSDGISTMEEYREIAKLFDCSPLTIISDLKYIRSTRNGCTIYGLCDPESGEIKYVGQTDGDPAYRHRRHISQTQHGRERNETKAKWITGLLAQRKEPELIILERCSRVELNERERWWINHLVDQGNLLVNRKIADAARENGRKGGRPRKQQETQTMKPNYSDPIDNLAVRVWYAAYHIKAEPDPDEVARIAEWLAEGDLSDNPDIETLAAEWLETEAA